MISTNNQSYNYLPQVVRRPRSSPDILVKFMPILSCYTNSRELKFLISFCANIWKILFTGFVQCILCFTSLNKTVQWGFPWIFYCITCLSCPRHFDVQLCHYLSFNYATSFTLSLFMFCILPLTWQWLIIRFVIEFCHLFNALYP